MARKDIDDRMVCLAYAYRHLLILGGSDSAPYPYELLSRWTGEPEKVCEAAMERAADRDLIEYGVSLRTGWLTEDGRALLGDTDIAAEIAILRI